MMQPYMMLSLLILGPSSLSNKIDGYLQAPIDKLKELWFDGINTYEKKGEFQDTSSNIWTINYFPTYAMLFESGTKGKLACPNAIRHMVFALEKINKALLYGTLSFLPKNHKF